MTSRQAAWLALAILGVIVVVAVWRLTPWRATDAGQRAERPASADFSAAEIDREERFHGALRPWTLSSLALTTLLAVVLGFTPFGAKLIELVARPLGGAWWAQAALGSIALLAVGQLISTPLAARAEVVLRRYGLSTQTWGSWALDRLKALALTAVLAGVLLLGWYAVVRALPRWWWAPTAAAAAIVTFGLSFLYPVLIEPVFNRFESMPNSQLRTELLQLAADDGVPVRDVLVADASRRTTALNAYVSGFGASRRLVVYDNLLADAPAAETKLVVAHELGHAKRNDVLIGTSLAALGAAILVVAGFLLLSWRPLLRQAGIESDRGLGDPRSLALVFALLALVGLLSAPVTNAISRAVEARADQHSLQLTHDPATFIAMHKRLARTNLSDLKPNPILYAMFASHPSTTERLGHARSYDQGGGERP